MKFSISGQEEGDFLIEVTAWAGLTIKKKELLHNLCVICKELLHNLCVICIGRVK